MHRLGDYNLFRNILKIPSALMALKWNASALQKRIIFTCRSDILKSMAAQYIAQILISDAGEVVRARRKLKPTHVERTIFGEGDGSDLVVDETPLGRLGLCVAGSIFSLCPNMPCIP